LGRLFSLWQRFLKFHGMNFLMATASACEIKAQNLKMLLCCGNA